MCVMQMQHFEESLSPNKNLMDESFTHMTPENRYEVFLSLSGGNIFLV